ncbi:transposase [Alicyclobacillus fodiniaquatilis]|uniref:Transposase n=1 Tax=Alicyclobacillus fodiniaquatilis TaxID=1661150 RepID=A0ABW4JDR5_9BACL
MQRYHFVFRIDIMETMPDHVHFLFQCDPQQRVYKVVK